MNTNRGAMHESETLGPTGVVVSKQTQHVPRQTISTFLKHRSNFVELVTLLNILKQWVENGFKYHQHSNSSDAILVTMDTSLRDRLLHMSIHKLTVLG